jgi:hypothetical protein
VGLVKGDTLPTERELEDWLVRDAGFSRSQAKTIISSGFKSLKSVRDAAVSESTDLGLAAVTARARALLS